MYIFLTRTTGIRLMRLLHTVALTLLLETIEYNFSLPIDKYIMVDFFLLCERG